MNSAYRNETEIYTSDAFLVSIVPILAVQYIDSQTIGIRYSKSINV